MKARASDLFALQITMLKASAECVERLDEQRTNTICEMNDAELQLAMTACAALTKEISDSWFSRAQEAET